MSGCCITTGPDFRGSSPLTITLFNFKGRNLLTNRAGIQYSSALRS
jgi:hypothetical protein